jgi:hypothetical protein
MKPPNIDLETQYSFEQNTLVIHIQILPKTENNQPRTAIVAVGIKNSPPIISSFPFKQLELPASIQSMLSQLEAELPHRKAAASELMEHFLPLVSNIQNCLFRNQKNYPLLTFVVQK